MSKRQQSIGEWLPKKQPSTLNYSHSNDGKLPPFNSGSAGSSYNTPLRLKSPPSASSPVQQSSQELEELQLRDDGVVVIGDPTDAESHVKSFLLNFSKSLPVVENKPTVSQSHSYTICGVNVEFPLKAYPSQIGVMEKVLRCLTGNQNGLVESPTGSGKSLALLCSSLAWQMRELDKQNESRKRTRTVMKADNASSGESVIADKKPKTTLGSYDCCGSTPADACVASGSNQTAEASGCAASNAWLPPPNAGIVGLNSIPEDAPTPTSELSPWNVEVNERSSSRASSPVVSVVSAKSGASRRHKVFDRRIRSKPRGVAFDEPHDDGETNDQPSSLSTDALERIRSLSYPGPSSGSREELEISDSVNVAEEKVPKIYFASRTHKQITQLVRELRKTSYGNLKMAILGSKEHYCVHPIVSRRGNKNEACQELLDTGLQEGQSRMPGCEYYNGVNKSSNPGAGFARLKRLGLEPVYDIEDLNNVGRKALICPFFTSKDLARDAQLVFCPYNYLVDARIRQTLEIDLTGQIVIFDEGHNMEDASREASSFSLSSMDLQNALDNMAEVTTVDGIRRKHGMAGFSQFSQSSQPDESADSSGVQACIKSIMLRCTRLLEWMTNHGKNITMQGIQSGSQEFIGNDFALHLQSVGLGPDEYREFTGEYDMIRDDKAAEAGRDDGSYPGQQKQNKVSGNTIMILRGLVVVLAYMFGNNKQHLLDYRFVLSKELTRNNAYIVDSNEFRRKRRKDELNDWLYKLNFWCLNPGVAFGDFLKAKSVVLTSGTLSPISSFQSELGIKFGIKFEANHVIDNKQVWAGGISRGPRNCELRGVYQNVQSLSYQDDIGVSILQICQIVPKGVLVFFTGYRVMETLLNRWQVAGILDAITTCKAVFHEPQGGDKAVFEATMNEFYSAINGDFIHPRQEGQTGAVMFAVCRGKISEGLDFADDNARAVVAVGIPFPNFKDRQIEMKKEYNDANTKRGLLTGSDWYDIQAFRALNQALGRCLRHRNDWGALVLLDTRFTHGSVQSGNNKFVQGLSKWLRPQIRSFSAFGPAMASLSQFIKERTADPAPPLPLPISCPSVLQEPESTESRVPAIAVVDENQLTNEELDALFASDEKEPSAHQISVEIIDDNLLTEDDMSSLFSSDDDFSPMKPFRR